MEPAHRQRLNRGDNIHPLERSDGWMEPRPYFRAKLALCWRVLLRPGMVDSNARPWPLYPSGVAPLDRPGYFSPESVKNRPEGRVFFNVTNVTLTPYLVDRGHPLFTGASVIVAPGGAYKWLTWDAEGTDIAAWLNSIGVSAFLLKYRVPFRPWLEPGALSCCPATPSCCVPPDRSPNYTDVRAARGPLIDAQRALSVVRARAPSLGLNATAVGFMGFSAGGHLGAQLGTTGLRRRLYARVDSADDAAWRAPDWLILVYPAYLVPTGRDVPPSDRTVTLNVTAEHPPTLLLQSEDGGFSYGSIYYYLALKAAAATASDACAACPA